MHGVPRRGLSRGFGRGMVAWSRRLPELDVGVEGEDILGVSLGAAALTPLLAAAEVQGAGRLTGGRGEGARDSTHPLCRRAAQVNGSCLGAEAAARGELARVVTVRGAATGRHDGLGGRLVDSRTRLWEALATSTSLARPTEGDAFAMQMS